MKNFVLIAGFALSLFAFSFSQSATRGASVPIKTTGYICTIKKGTLGFTGGAKSDVRRLLLNLKSVTIFKEN